MLAVKLSMEAVTLLMQPSPGSVTLFYSYAHEDEDLRNQLDKHLSLLRRQGYLSTWYDRDIYAGDDRAKQIYNHLESAQIILLLISADFLASDYCYIGEMQRALARHAAGEARVIPIILRPVDWKHDPVIRNLQALPTDGKPVTTWPGSPSYDAAFADIAQGIRVVVEDLLNGQYKPEQQVFAERGSTNQRLQEQRRETCLRLLVSIREFVSIVAEYRQMHDDLLMRAKIGFTSRQHKSKIKAQFQSIESKLILTGSELSLDPNGKSVLDAFVAYMQAQARYLQAMMRPMANPFIFAFGKTDTAVLDMLSKQANDQLSVLEKVSQDFIQSA